MDPPLQVHAQAMDVRESIFPDFYDVASLQKPCLLLTEVMSQSMDPTPKLHALHGSGSLFPVL